MAVQPGGAFEVALYDNDFFTNASNDDLKIRTMLPSQKIHLGTTSNQMSAIMITSNTVTMNNNLYVYSSLGVGKSNLSQYPVDIIGDTAIDGSINMTKYMLCRGVQLRKKTGSYFAPNFLPTGVLQGFSNESSNGVNIYVSQSTSNNYVRVTAGTANEVLRVTGNGLVGINTSNPLLTLDISATDAIQLPVGTTMQRPANARQGCIRYNATTGLFEGYTGTNTWGAIGGSVLVDTNTSTSTSNAPTANALALTTNTAVAASNQVFSNLVTLTNLLIDNTISTSTSNAPTSRALATTNNTAVAASNQAFSLSLSLSNVITNSFSFFQPPVNPTGSNTIQSICRVQGAHWGSPMTIAIAGAFNQSMTAMYAVLSSSFQMVANQWYKVPCTSHNNQDATSFSPRMLVRNSNNAIEIALARESGTQLSTTSNMIAFVESTGLNFGGQISFSNITTSSSQLIQSSTYNSLPYWTNAFYSNEAFSVASATQLSTGANVGIKTNNPVEALHVTGNIRVDGSYGAYAVFGLSTSAYGAGQSDLVWLQPAAQYNYNITLDAGGVAINFARAGMYSITAKINSDHSNTGECILSVFLNNSGTWSVIQSESLQPTGSWNGSTEVYGHFMIYATAGQQCKIVLTNNTGQMTYWSYGSAAWSRCMIYRVG